MRHFLFFLTLSFILTPIPANAVAIGAALGAISSGLTWLGSTAIGSFLLQTAASFALSALSSALAPGRGEAKQRGVQTKATTSGGTQPQTIIFGRYATGGNSVCPPMTHGKEGGDIVKFLNYVFDISDFRITAIDWVYVDGEKQRFVGNEEFYGIPASGSRFSGNAWMRFYDGTQAAADPMLVDIYDEYTRPWTEDHLLAGVSYAVLTFKYDQQKFKGFPEIRFEVRGARLYDPRRDDTAGGSGFQRWDDQDTWEYTENPVVMVYNILRGIRLEDDSVYGMRVDVDDLPIGRWVAAMNACDELVPTPEGLQPRYKAGTEFSLDQEPLDVIEEILKSCGGHVAESGGAWNVSVGPAPFPVASFTDESIVISAPREFEPFRGLNQTYNGIHASYLNPDKNWQARDAAPYYRADLEAEDGGRRLIADLKLPTVTERRQVQRLMQEMLLDNRRMLIHSLTLPPTALGILPLDTITWTSAYNGYQDKLFEVQSKTIDPETLNVRVKLRERDVGDYSYDYEYAPEIPDLPTYGEDIADGAPEDDVPEETYIGPITGEVLEPQDPAPGTGDVIALHSNALNRSNDGGANWTVSPVPLAGCQDISVLSGGGYVILTASGAHFSSDTRGWDRLEFPVQGEIALGLVNGDFEAADLTAWETTDGAPQVIDAMAPAQQGGAWYLTGQDYAVEQVLDLPAQDTEEVVISADVYAGGSSEATLSVYVSEKLPQLTGNQSWSGLVITNYATAPDGSQLDLRIISGDGSAIISDSSSATNILDLQYTNGTSYGGAWVLGLYSLTRTKRVFVPKSQYVDLITQPGSEVRYTSKPKGGEIRNLSFSGSDNAGVVLSSCPVEVLITTVGSKVGIGPNGLQAGYNSYEYARITLSSKTADRPAWQTVKINGGFQDKSQVRIRLEGSGTDAYFDNVKAYVQTTNADLPQAISADFLDRRHIVACRDGIHAVDEDGLITALGALPFSPDIVAANGDTLVVASGSSIAISTYGGGIWDEHTAGGIVSQVFAAPQPAAVLTSGDVLSVSGAGLTVEHSFGAERWLLYAKRPGEWIAVDRNGAIEAGGLSAWSPGIDQPETSSALPRRILTLDAGRRIGWNDVRRDIFYRDLSASDWGLGNSLVDDIRALKEIK